MGRLALNRRLLINTPLQRGDLALAEGLNRFSGFLSPAKPPPKRSADIPVRSNGE